MKLNETVLNQLAMDGPDPTPWWEMTQQLGTNMVTQPELPGVAAAPVPGQSAPFTQMIQGGGAAQTPIPPQMMAQMMQQMQPQPANLQAPPGAAPRRMQAPKVPGVPESSGVPSLAQILGGGRG